MKNNNISANLSTDRGEVHAFKYLKYQNKIVRQNCAMHKKCLICHFPN